MYTSVLVHKMMQILLIEHLSEKNMIQCYLLGGVLRHCLVYPTVYECMYCMNTLNIKYKSDQKPLYLSKWREFT